MLKRFFQVICDLELTPISGFISSRHYLYSLTLSGPWNQHIMYFVPQSSPGWSFRVCLEDPIIRSNFTFKWKFLIWSHLVSAPPELTRHSVTDPCVMLSHTPLTHIDIHYGWTAITGVRGGILARWDWQTCFASSPLISLCPRMPPTTALSEYSPFIRYFVARTTFSDSPRDPCSWCHLWLWDVITLPPGNRYDFLRMQSQLTKCWGQNNTLLFSHYPKQHYYDDFEVKLNINMAFNFYSHYDIANLSAHKILITDANNNYL